MKKVVNFITKKPIFCLLIITIVLFSAPAITARPQSSEKLIVKNIGVDKTGDEYEVSVLTYIPKPAQVFSENYHVVSSKGTTIKDAMFNISKLTGKNVALAESNLIIVNQELCEYGMLPALDFLVREYSLGNNSNVFCSDSAKEIIKRTKDLSQNLGILMQDIAEYNKVHVLPAYNYLEEVYAASLSPNKAMLISIINLSEEEGLETQESADNSSNSGGEESSGETPQGQSGGEKTKIVNDGGAMVLKRGKKAMILSPEEVFALSWGKAIEDFGIVKIDDYNSEVFTNAKISFYVFRNEANIKTKFEDGLPVCDINIHPLLVLDEVEQEQLNIDFYHNTYNLGSHEMLDELNAKIGKDFSKIFKTMLKEKLDVFDLYENFNANNTSEFKKFLKNFENVDDFLSKVEVRINVKTTLVE